MDVIGRKNPALKMPAFVFSLIRDPLSRCMSAFYHFRVARKKIKYPPTAEDKIYYLKNQCSNYMTGYLKPRSGKKRWPKDGPETVDAIMNGTTGWTSPLAFIGVVELYDESMVLLAHLLNLPLGDVLYQKAKVSGNEMKASVKSGKMLAIKHLPVDNEPLEVQNFVRSPDWHGRNNNDYELFRRVKERIASMYATVPGLNASLATYRQLLLDATTACDGDSRKTCYWKDNGCGFACLDEFYDASVTSGTRSVAADLDLDG